MLETNPFSLLSEVVPTVVMQGFIIAMVLLIVFGTIIQMIHHKNLTYFFNNAKKAKLQATRDVGAAEKAKIIVKTTVYDIGTTSELGFGKRRLAHVLGMYGTIIFWIASAMLVFCYTGADKTSSTLWPMLWHAGAILTCVGGFWFWFFLRVDVSAEAHPWYRIIKADLFVLALLACSTFGLAWSYTQFNGQVGLSFLFFALFVVSNLVLFGGVYWSKFAHMFYKPGAAIQKNLAEADGSRDNLPPPADAPEQFGLGIKREEPKHY
ncbi:adenylyl-sulfate reductase [Candidatus Pelagibacter sp.]|uniref:adenylyl-sulfate reductase n=1 Tax=Candidatus Pelagibacter sp. TaxID=2024849 RepID=UPI003F83116D